MGLSGLRFFLRLRRFNAPQFALDRTSGRSPYGWFALLMRPSTFPLASPDSVHAKAHVLSGLFLGLATGASTSPSGR